MPRPMPSLLCWGASQAGQSLAHASTAWLVSGLTASPLVNSLLPALSSLPALLPLPRLRSGYGLQVAAAVLLLLVSLGWLGDSVVWPLLAVALLALGGRVSGLPIQRQLLRSSGLAMARLRMGSDLGQWLGTLLTGLLFPLGRALAQYLHALALLLPLGWVLLRSAAARPGDPGAPGGHAEPPAATDSANDPGGTPSLATPTLSWRGPGLDRACVAQGCLFGALFALLALWVRQVGEGNCFDFGMVLSAYGLGRGLAGRLPLMPRWTPYAGMTALLLCTQLLPGWGAVALFLPLGGLAAASDRALVASLAEPDPASGWERLERSSAVGGLVGSLAMGTLAQAAGLAAALPLQLAGFAVATVLGLRGARGTAVR